MKKPTLQAVPEPDTIIGRFMAVFPANPRLYGVFNPQAQSATDASITMKGHPYGPTQVQSHLDGGLGLGLVPILDNDTCWWAALDIDVHDGKKKKRVVDLIRIAQLIRQYKLPLILCRSKSGGAHVYLFLREATRVARVRPVLDRWSAKLEHRGCEIFPKQVVLPKQEDGSLQMGSWINLPYFDAHSTQRYALVADADGNVSQLPFIDFLGLAETMRYTLTAADERGDEDYQVGPPCLEAMLQNPIDEGNRNTAVFQAGVFLKRAFKDDWKSRLTEFNQNGLEAQLDTRELKTIIGSISRKDYQYKCREEPCKTLCNRDLCKTREFGITADDSRVNEVPPIDRVEKILGTPIRWALHMRGKEIEVTTPQLFDYNQLRQAVSETLHILLPRMKADEWDLYLRQILEAVTIRQGATAEDILYGHLLEFLRRASVDRGRAELDRRSDLLRHMPALVQLGAVSGQYGDDAGGVGAWFFAFRAQDFTQYLRRLKMLTIPDHQIPAALYKLLGPTASRDRIRVGEQSARNVWTVPDTAVQDEVVPTREFKTEY